MTPTLQQMLASGPTAWYRMEATEDRSAEVFLYGEIGGWWGGIEAAEFVRELAALDVDEIQLRVNSPGGSVYDGVSIMNALRRHPARVIATVDGLAASAASFLIQAADEVVMGHGTELMIHDAWGVCIGNANAMDRTRQDLDRLSNTIAGIYAERAGGEVSTWRDAMLAETWYTAEEAVTAGLADRVDGDADTETDAAASWRSLPVFAHAGRAAAPAPRAAGAGPRKPLSLTTGHALPAAVHAAAQAAPTLPAEPADSTHPEKKGAGPMTDIQQGLRDRLGLPADAALDEDGLLAALDEALAERAEPTNTSTAAPAGTIVVDQAAFEDLQAAAAEGRQARAAQLTAERTNAVNAAVSDGRISPARREHWLASLEADPGALTVLEGLPKNTVPVAAAGYTGGVDEAPDDDSNIYARAWGDDGEKKGA